MFIEQDWTTLNSIKTLLPSSDESSDIDWDGRARFRFQVLLTHRTCVVSFQPNHQTFNMKGVWAMTLCNLLSEQEIFQTYRAECLCWEYCKRPVSSLQQWNKMQTGNWSASSNALCSLFRKSCYGTTKFKIRPFSINLWSLRIPFQFKTSCHRCRMTNLSNLKNTDQTCNG